MATKIGFEKAMEELFQPPVGEFVEIEARQLRYVMVDGAGNPNASDVYARALEWLCSGSNAVEFAAKADVGQNYVVPPLEGLWWADDPLDFMRRTKDAWKWMMMIMMPDFVSAGAGV